MENAEIIFTFDEEVRSSEDVHQVDAWWRAANYLSVGQIYLCDNPLLQSPLRPEHVKPRPLGHWGTTPGLNFLYAHLNRLIRQRALDMIFVCGPGHGGPALVANTWLEGSYSEIYPSVAQDEEGLLRLFRQFSFPGGIPSHVGPQTPGSIHEGGEAGHALSHAYGAAFDNPELIVACVIGDGEAETGPLAASWHSNKFLNPDRDGAVLPILHLNGGTIHNPTLLARMPTEELISLLAGYGYVPHFVEASEPEPAHRRMAEVLDTCVEEIHAIQKRARAHGFDGRPRWPMIVLRTPKGWSGPKSLDSKSVHGDPRQLPMLEEWLRSYRPEELFDRSGKPCAEIRSLAPEGALRMGANPHANPGARDLRLPGVRDYAVRVEHPGGCDAEATRVTGAFLRDVMGKNLDSRNFRVFGAGATLANRLAALFEVTGRAWTEPILPGDEFLSPEGRVVETLSEQTCLGWLEGYLLTGRHGLFSTHEAYARVIDSLFDQHAKWLSATGQIRWRRPLPSMTYLLTSHGGRQEPDGVGHQDPGFLDRVVSRGADTIRVYLPPDANTLLCVTERCLRSRHQMNVIVAGKESAPQWLEMDAALRHCDAGIGIWEWASSDRGREPDVVMACCGDVPTLETLCAVDLLRHHFPQVKVRVVNVVDLMKLQPASEHPHGLPDKEFDALFTRDKPVIFAFHGSPWLIHRLTQRRANPTNLHVRGIKETTAVTTPFDRVVQSELDRFHLVADVLERVPGLGVEVAYAHQELRDKLSEHRHHIARYGEDLPEIREWRWRS